METVIARLLTDFEQGKLDRRQLIKHLAIAASVASAASATPSAPWKATAVNHVSYEVSDYAKTRDFYADLFGMKVSHDDGKQCYMEFGATHFIPRNARAGVQTPRVGHVAYTIEPWDRKEVEAELKRRGLDPRPDEETSFHIKDPNGYDVQLCRKEMKQ